MDAILDKEEYTIEELLDEDELIQECKSLNARLTAFLKQKSSVQSLVAYLVEEPSEDADAKRQFKFPFAACEIFCCEVEGIYNTLLESDDLLDQLFSILHLERPLNSMLAGYFARVVGSLLIRRSTDLMQYLQRRRDILPALVKHVDTTSVAEVLARIVGADDPRGYTNTAAMQWLVETDVLQLLVDSLGHDTPAEGQANAAEVLAAVARSISSPLTRSMASSDFMERLVDSALAPHDGRAATHALNVCIALLEPPPLQDPALLSHLGGVAGVPNGPADIHEQLQSEAIRCVAAAADRLVSMLSSHSTEELRTSYGVIHPPVGQLRLKAIDLLAALLRTAHPAAEEAVMKTQGVQCSMELFLNYPFNNALHSGVAALLTSFEPGSDTLRSFLLRDAKLIEWLISAPEEVTPEQYPDDPFKEKRKSLRAGYCGHLTQIANRLLHLSETCELIRDVLAQHEGWQTHVLTRLEPRNKLESVFAWKCGRPASHTSNLAGDNGMFQTDMAFPAMDASSFSREVYQRYGVYEEDDDDDEEGTRGGSWVMDLASSGANGMAGAGDGSGKLPPPAFAARFGMNDSSDSDEDSDVDSDDESPLAQGGRMQDTIVNAAAAALTGIGRDSLEDLDDDAVVVAKEDDDAATAAESLMSLQVGMESISLGGDRDGGDGGIKREARAVTEEEEQSEEEQSEKEEVFTRDSTLVSPVDVDASSADGNGESNNSSEEKGEWKADFEEAPTSV